MLNNEISKLATKKNSGENTNTNWRFVKIIISDIFIGFKQLLINTKTKVHNDINFQQRLSKIAKTDSFCASGVDGGAGRETASQAGSQTGKPGLITNGNIAININPAEADYSTCSVLMGPRTPPFNTNPHSFKPKPEKELLRCRRILKWYKKKEKSFFLQTIKLQYNG